MQENIAVIECEIIHRNTADEDNNEIQVPNRVFVSPSNLYLTNVGNTIEKDGSTYTYVLSELKDITLKFCVACGKVYEEEKCCERMRLRLPEPLPYEIEGVIYHGGCQDGVGSLWAIKSKMRQINEDYPVQGYGSSHSTKDSKSMNLELDNIRSMCSNRSIAIVDFAYAPEIILEIKKMCSKFILIDHHIGNQETLEGEPNCYFDLTHSAAWLAWAYMETGVPLQIPPYDPPWLIHYIHTRDTYSFDRQDTPHRAREICEAIWVDLHNDIKKFDDAQKGGEESMKKLQANGTLYYKYKQMIVKSNMKSKVKVVEMHNGIKAAIANLGGMPPSDAAEDMLETHKDCRMAVVWYHVPDRSVYKFHLRARDIDSDINVSNLCKRFNGSGHAAAAGFEISDAMSYPNILKMMIDGSDSLLVQNNNNNKKQKLY